MEYNDFLKNKTPKISQNGIEVIENELNENLYDFQKFIVKTALQKGKYAIFAECGLGKTIMQLEWAYQIFKHENKPVLIIAPLAVSYQTIEEGAKFNIIIEKFNNVYDNKIYITNYEQLDNIDCSQFIGVVLDESSILKNESGKIRNNIIDSFKYTKYKLCCTATPSPNDSTEIGNHTEFLNIISRNSLLSKYFVHDSGNTSEWRLKKHAKKDFYKFIGSWACFLKNPKDIGFNEVNFELPKLNINELRIQTTIKEEYRLFNNIAVNAVNFNKELRNSLKERLDKVIEIVNNNPKNNYIIWIKLNEEGDYLKKYISDAIEVRGNQDADIKEKYLLGFAKNEFRVLITKPKIAMFGLNWQNCHNQIFASLDFSFESLYQSIRRSYRYGQKEEVNIDIITTDTMQNVIKSINKKEDNFNNLRNDIEMNNEIFDLESSNTNNVFENEFCKLINGDCITEIKSIPDKYIDFSIFSPPFADLYVYSNDYRDLGNSNSYDEFKIHFNFLTKELSRIIKSGRLVAIHCMDLPIQKGKEGYIGLRDFSGYIIESMINNNFIYHSRITIWKNPVVEMQRTKALGLLHKQLKKDSTMSRVGNPDYILLFRNNGDNLIPIKQDISIDLWQEWASPVWMDIEQGYTLNREEARSENDEKHICPLQLDVIKRLIALYSNKGEKVFTPFLGIGSEIYESILNNRYGIGIELKSEYFNVAVKNCKTAIEKMNQPNLF